MSIKQSIAALLLLISVSFSASAEYYTVLSVANGTVDQCADRGDVVSSLSDLASCVTGKYWSGDPYSALNQCAPDSPYNGRLYMECKAGGTTIQTHYLQINQGCPSGTSLNSETGQCEESQYCDLPSTMDEISAARLQCESGGKQFFF